MSCSDKIKFYHGYIFDSDKKPIVGIKVYEDDNFKNYSLTDKNGYFNISEENNFGGNLIVVKNDEVVLDTIWTVFSNHGDTLNYGFVNGRNDTLFIDVNKVKR